MNFKKGKLYRVVKGGYGSRCVGCVLRFTGFIYEGSNIGTNWGKSIKKRDCTTSGGSCHVFQWMINHPLKYKLVELESMVKFCKKLRKELRK